MNKLIITLLFILLNLLSIFIVFVLISLFPIWECGYCASVDYTCQGWPWG